MKPLSQSVCGFGGGAAVIQVDEYIFRGPRPKNADEYNTLRELGIQALLNLESGWLDHLTGTINYEAESALTRGMVPLHIQLSPLFLPSVEAIRAAILALKHSTATKVNIYIHCKDGVDRTGLVVAAWRVLHSQTTAGAMDEMFKMGFHSTRYFYWLPRIRSVLELLK